jgi:hypothetical protein
VTEAAPVPCLAAPEIENTEPLCAASALYVAPATAAAQRVVQTQLALDFR